MVDAPRCGDPCLRRCSPPSQLLACCWQQAGPGASFHACTGWAGAARAASTGPPSSAMHAPCRKRGGEDAATAQAKRPLSADRWQQPALTEQQAAAAAAAAHQAQQAQQFGLTGALWG